jgi:lysophospholipase L1-like esterase
MTSKRHAVLAAVSVLLSLLVTTAVLLAGDLYLHKRAERSAGLNRWGYRGPVAGRKQPGEVRVVMLGGSTVFGYGLYWYEAAPVALERHLNEPRIPGQPPVAVFNLGFNGEGAHSYPFTLEDFSFLDYDVAVLYDGYNDLAGDRAPNRAVFRHKSLVFRATGYYPITPLMLLDKAAQLRKREGQTVFRPNLAERASAGAVQAAADITRALERQIGGLAGEPIPRQQDARRLGCAPPWVTYCDSMYLAVEDALHRGKRVAVVLQPVLAAALRDVHASQQTALRGMMQQQFAGNDRVRLVDLSRAVDLSDEALCFDGMHLTTAGTNRTVEVLAPQIAPLLVAASNAAP